MVIKDPERKFTMPERRAPFPPLIARNNLRPNFESVAFSADNPEESLWYEFFPHASVFTSEYKAFLDKTNKQILNLRHERFNLFIKISFIEMVWDVLSDDGYTFDYWLNSQYSDIVIAYRQFRNELRFCFDYLNFQKKQSYSIKAIVRNSSLLADLKALFVNAGEQNISTLADFANIEFSFYLLTSILQYHKETGYKLDALQLKLILSDYDISSIPMLDDKINLALILGKQNDPKN